MDVLSPASIQVLPQGLTEIVRQRAVYRLLKPRDLREWAGATAVPRQRRGHSTGGPCPMINPWPYAPASDAPGWPGIEPRWTSSAKSGVGTSLSAMSRTWFTLSHGILNEIYYRRPDQACTRDLGLIVTGDH